MDRLNSISVRDAQRAAFAVLDQFQREEPAMLLAGVSMMYSLLVRRFKLDGRDVLAQADRRIEDALKDPHLRAIKDYLAKELA